VLLLGGFADVIRCGWDSGVLGEDRPWATGPGAHGEPALERPRQVGCFAPVVAAVAVVAAFTAAACSAAKARASALSL
jgi:hypothetical protein